MTPPGTPWVETDRGWALERDGARLACIDPYAEGWRAQVGQRFSPGGMITLDAVQRWAERTIEESALPIDDDAIRDLVVARTARGECAACARTTPACRSYVQLEGRPGVTVITGPCEIVGERQNYPCCDQAGCADWLDAQELLGRLPHQSAATPQARWVQLPPWPDVWAIYVGANYIAHLRPRDGAWAVHVLAGDLRSPPLPFGDAQRWAEVEVVRARRRSTPSTAGQRADGIVVDDSWQVELARETDLSRRALEAFLEQDALVGRRPFTQQYDQQLAPRPERTWPSPRRNRR